MSGVMRTRSVPKTVIASMPKTERVILTRSVPKVKTTKCTPSKAKKAKPMNPARTWNAKKIPTVPNASSCQMAVAPEARTTKSTSKETVRPEPANPGKTRNAKRIPIVTPQTS